MTNTTDMTTPCDHKLAWARAQERPTNLARCYLDACRELVDDRAKYLCKLDSLEQHVKDLDAKSRGDDTTIAALLVEIAALRAQDALRVDAPGRATALPQIDPGMIPAGCALPAFDGLEEAQMAAGAGFDPYLQTR